jgi:hypothetical protein
MLNFESLERALSNSLFEEYPVDLDTFIAEDGGYLNLRGVTLSDHQKALIERASQIYRYDALEEWLGAKQAKIIMEERSPKQVIAVMGKGCVTRDAEVYNPQTGGWDRIDSLLDSTSGGTCYGIREGKGIQQFRTEAFSMGEDLVYEVITGLGHAIKVNSGHRFLTPHGMFPLEQLDVGNKIAIPCGLPISETIPVDEGTLPLLVHDTISANEMPQCVWRMPSAQVAKFVSMLQKEELTLPIIRQLRRLAARIGVMIDSLGNYAPIENYDGDIYWDHVAMIRLIGREEIFTITAPDSGNYVANMIFNGNSGKDFSSQIAIAYMIHKLLCLRDPAAYYRKPPGDSIDIINVATNAQQAKNVFFSGFARMIANSPWFQNRAVPKIESVHFDKNINLYSGHSEREAFEGYNTIAVVLDEISGFATDSKTTADKTADKIYKMYKQSVASRFGEVGKLILLSFPRTNDDFIFTLYNEVVDQKHVVKRSQLLKRNEKLPDGIEENELLVEWDEDHIISYKDDVTWALRRPTWEVNPTVRLEVNLKDAFFSDPLDSLTRFAAMPSDSIDGFFRAPEKVALAVSRPVNAIINNDALDYDYPVDDEAHYFIHVDLAQKHDRCVVALAHVADWKRRDYGGGMVETQPRIVVDAIKYWTPEPSKLISLVEVRDFIEGLARHFKVRKITFDQWQSAAMIEYFQTQGFDAERLSVGKEHYNDFKLMVLDERISIPYDEILIKEMNTIAIMPNGRIDHPRKGSKDLADAVCGAAYNAATLTPKTTNELKIITAGEYKAQTKIKQNPMINPPRSRPENLPPALREFLQGWKSV